MNVNEAKSLLLLYRLGTADADDPQMAQALALANNDSELSAWLAGQGARQAALRVKFQQIAPPPGLREQIISEYNVQLRSSARRRSVAVAVTASLALVVVALLALFHLPPREPDSRSLAVYQNEMVSFALKGYGMDVLTNDPAVIRAYLTRRAAPADFTLPAGLQHATLVGCAVESWQNATVSLVCFRIGKPLAPGAQNDLWLFVVDSTAIKDPPQTGVPKFATVNRLITATWTEGGKLYLVGVEGTKDELQQYLLNKISKAASLTLAAR